MKGGITLGFWDDEKCEYCNGPIIEKIVDLPRKIGKRYVLIKNVPAGVCKKCGTRYYAANILKTIESSICSRRKAESEIPMAVYSL
ncbi:YgiT-type zinc finger protein [Patescibacteria group bacterium]|nr:YgiT-type zinc finger protein [Patescibacteria group bacterium]